MNRQIQNVSLYNVTTQCQRRAANISKIHKKDLRFYLKQNMKILVQPCL
jgi:hypothetical protein